MKKTTSCDGQELRGMFSAATNWLERSAESINMLNVFPVPDGDTGTNMLLTMRAAMEEAGRCSDGSAAEIAQAMAKGSLMGARGNSGVILSQIFSGLARGLNGKHSFDGNDFAGALVESTTLAYNGISNPVEGTILTVIREATDAAHACCTSVNSDLLTIMEAVVAEARASVYRTPMLLPVLRQAGVVDAGGQGLYVVFEGALRYLRDEIEDIDITPVEAITAISQGLEEDGIYGYCTEFLLQGKGLDLKAMRETLANIGESLIVVGDESTVRVHLHTFDPGAALSYATSLGTLKQVKVENMDEQHRDFIAAQAQITTAEIATIAVVAGEGLAEAFYSIGASIVVPCGETMNPSVQELLHAVESAPSDKVIILPNNPNVVLAAHQTSALTHKTVEVVPTKTIPQGIAALLVLNQETDLATNTVVMKEVLSTVFSGEITRAVRSMELDGISVREGQAIAFLDGELVAASDSMAEVIFMLLSRVDVEHNGLVTIYYGADTSTAEAEQTAESIRDTFPVQEVDIVNGGQPHYNFIISVE